MGGVASGPYLPWNASLHLPVSPTRQLANSPNSKARKCRSSLHQLPAWYAFASSRRDLKAHKYS